MYKTCKTCQEHKPLEAFHRHAKGQLGRYNKCKCCRGQEYLRQPLYNQCERNIKCNRCLTEKSKEEFYVNRSNKLGSFTICKNCHKASKKEPIDDFNKYVDKLLEKYNEQNQTEKLEREQVLEILKNQNQCCAITKHQFTYLINKDGTLDHIWNMRILNKNILVCDFIYSASRIYGYNFEQLQSIYKELSV